MESLIDLKSKRGKIEEYFNLFFIFVHSIRNCLNQNNSILMKSLFFLLTFTLLISCNESVTKEAANLPGFEISKISGTEFSKAVKKDPESGQIIEEGELYQGKLSGTWVKYDKSKHTVQTISTFVSRHNQE